MKTDVHSADVFSAFSCLTNHVELPEKLSSPLQGGVTVLLQHHVGFTLLDVVVSCSYRF